MTTRAASSDDIAQASGKRPQLIGLVGGVACGKSTVAKLLAEHGGLWLDCDRIAHEMLELPEVIEAITAEFSPSVLGANGLVDRKRLAALVFGSDKESVARRRWLEHLLHPRIRAICEQQIAAAGDRYPAIIIDAPLLIEAGWADRCDRVVLVEAPLEQRRRLAAGRGWSPEELEKRERSQLPIEEKRRRATDILDNSGSLEDLRMHVARLWNDIHHLRPENTVSRRDGESQ